MFNDLRVFRSYFLNGIVTISLRSVTKEHKFIYLESIIDRLLSVVNSDRGKVTKNLSLTQQKKSMKMKNEEYERWFVHTLTETKNTVIKGDVNFLTQNQITETICKQKMKFK